MTNMPPLPPPSGGFSDSLSPEESLKYPQKSFPKDKVKLLLLENVHISSVEHLRNQGYTVEALAKALSEEELIAKVADVHILGVRSKSQVTAKVLQAAKRLIAVGCFCIGTNQVNLDEAEKLGVPVFNSPFQSTRSVAELILGEIIALSRKFTDKTMEMHNGVWNKSGAGAFEIRGRVLGIIGYGHIGSAMSVLAEAVGLKVIYYDIEQKCPYGNSTMCSSIESLMSQSDYVTLHVPLTEGTKMMIREEHIRAMKPGSYLLNASRGQVVDIDALAAALKDGHVAGAAVDVFPTEPAANGPGFVTPLQGCPNVIMTPHIGGSTAEAQEKIGMEVASKITRVINEGFTATAVNFPNVDITMTEGSHRLLHVHKNVPGVLKKVNAILGEYNVLVQSLQTSKHVGYLVVDLDHDISSEAFDQLSAIPDTIRCRILY